MTKQVEVDEHNGKVVQSITEYEETVVISFTDGSSYEIVARGDDTGGWVTTYNN